ATVLVSSTSGLSEPGEGVVGTRLALRRARPAETLHLFECGSGRAKVLDADYTRRKPQPMNLYDSTSPVNFGMNSCLPEDAAGWAFKVSPRGSRTGGKVEQNRLA